MLRQERRADQGQERSQPYPEVGLALDQAVVLS